MKNNREKLWNLIIFIAVIMCSSSEKIGKVAVVSDLVFLIAYNFFTNVTMSSALKCFNFFLEFEFPLYTSDFIFN